MSTSTESLLVVKAMVCILLPMRSLIMLRAGVRDDWRMPSSLLTMGGLYRMKVLADRRRTALIDEDDLLLEEVFRVLPGICHRRGTADEDGVLSVEAADPFQPPEHVGHMAAEDSAVDVKFVHHHVLQVGKELLPLGVVRQDAGVQHVRVGDHHVALLADRLPGVVRRVAVIGEGLDVRLQFADETMHFRHLVVGQGLCGKEVDGPGLGLLEDLLEHGDVVAQGLAAGRGRDEDHVLALVHQLDGAGLVAVELTRCPVR